MTGNGWPTAVWPRQRSPPPPSSTESLKRVYNAEITSADIGKDLAALQLRLKALRARSSANSGATALSARF